MQKIVVLDWGKPLMRVFRDMDGRMSDWPVVEARPDPYLPV
jgi:hypothetical protein